MKYVILQKEYMGKITLAPRAGGSTFDIDAKDLLKFEVQE